LITGGIAKSVLGAGAEGGTETCGAPRSGVMEAGTGVGSAGVTGVVAIVGAVFAAGGMVLDAVTVNGIMSGFGGAANTAVEDGALAVVTAGGVCTTGATCTSVDGAGAVDCDVGAAT